MAPSKKRKAVAIPEAELASDVASTPPVKRGRGRPSKGATEQTQAVVTPPPTKRGRPSKADKSASLQLNQATIPTSTLVHRNNNTPVKASGKASATANTSLRRSSRHESGADADINGAIAATASRATRNSKNGATGGAVVAVKETKAKAKGKAKAASPVKVTKSKPTRGVATKKMPAKAKGKAARTATINEEEEEDDSSLDEDSPPEPLRDLTVLKNRRDKVSVNVPSRKLAAEQAEDADEEDADEPSYWLMKAEPESRIEKGKDVKFSIDDLKNAAEPEGWDGKFFALRSSAIYLLLGLWNRKLTLTVGVRNPTGKYARQFKVQCKLLM